MSEEYVEENKKFRIDWKAALLIACILLFFVFIAISAKERNWMDDECCQIVCDKVGNGLFCDGHDGNYVYCGLNYAKYGVPEANEIFRFRVDNRSICEVVDVGGFGNESIQDSLETQVRNGS